MAKIERRRSKEIQGADLTPMIDVVFLLLVFFMVATNFVEETQQYDIELPKAEDAQVIKAEETLSIVIHKFEAEVKPEERIIFRLNKDPVTRDLLYKKLEAAVKAGDIKSTVIKADKDARYQDIISVISCLHALEVTDFNLAVMGG